MGLACAAQSYLLRADGLDIQSKVLVEVLCLGQRRYLQGEVIYGVNAKAGFMSLVPGHVCLLFFRAHAAAEALAGNANICCSTCSKV